MVKIAERKYTPLQTRGAKYYQTSKKQFNWEGPGYLLGENLHFSYRKKHHFFSLKRRSFDDDEEE